MARTNSLANFLTDVANAIRTKKGTETTIAASTFDTEILNLPSGTYQTKNITISANGSQTITPDTGYDAIDEITITTQVPQKQLQTKSYEFTTNQTIELTPDTGYDGFDIVTLTINVPQSSGGDIKLFETVQTMQADPNPSEGDLAVVYREEIQPITEESEFDSCTFPNTVVLDETFTGSIYGSFRSTGSGWFDGRVELSSSNFRFDGYGDTMVRVQYTSNDGITYTRTDGGEELQEFGTTIKWESDYGEFNSIMGNFMKIGGNYFEGLYQYSSTYLDNNYINTPISLEITNVSMGEYSSTSSYNVVYNTTLCSKIAVSDILEKCNLVYNTLKGSSDSCMPIFYVDKNGNYVYMVQGANGATPSNWYAGTRLSSVVADETNKITKINYIDYNYNIYYATVNPNTSEIQYTFVTTYERYYYTYPTGSSVRKDVRFVYTIPEPAMIPITLTLDYDTRLIKGVGDMVDIDYLETNNENFCTTPKSVSNKVSIYYLDPKYLLAKSQINVTPDYVYEKTFYGKNGVENGTLTTNVSNSFADANAEIYNTIQNQYENMEPRILTDDDKTIAKNIYFIPVKKDGTPLLNTDNVTDMYRMFDDCINLTTIPELDTSKATDMERMFGNCKNLTTIPELSTSNVTNMFGMFHDCKNLVTIPKLDTSNVTDMVSMFQNCSSLTTIPELNTGKATSIRFMFSDCINLTTIPLLDTSKAVDMQGMFEGCSSLSDDSLNVIMQMCINATSYAGTKTLKYMGLTSEQADKCKTLSNYSAFTSAGWTTGY